MTKSEKRMIMRWGLVFLAAMLFAPFAAKKSNAGDILLEWTDPVSRYERVGAGPLSPQEIDRISIYELVGTTSAGVEQYTVEGRPPGTYVFVGAAYDTDGEFSCVSGEAVKQVTDFSVGGDTTVYTVGKTSFGFTLFAVGTVPSGTSCDVDKFVNAELPNSAGLAVVYGVDPGQVAWSGSLQTQLPLAVCE